MVFSPASLADRLLPLSDEEITDIYMRDLEEVLPGFSDIVTESHIQRWPLGAPYCFPGRAAIQEELMTPEDRVFLAGDYLGSLYTETAITSAFTAAQRAASILATESQYRRSGGVTDGAATGTDGWLQPGADTLTESPAPHPLADSVAPFQPADASADPVLTALSDGRSATATPPAAAL